MLGVCVVAMLAMLRRVPALAEAPSVGRNARLRLTTTHRPASAARLRACVPAETASEAFPQRRRQKRSAEMSAETPSALETPSAHATRSALASVSMSASAANSEPPVFEAPRR